MVVVVDAATVVVVVVVVTTSIMDIHLHDISFQKFCCEQAGLVIRKCFLMYIISLREPRYGL